MDGESVLELAVELGYQLQVAGGEIYRVEESIGRVLAAYGVSGGQVFAIPNCIIASVTTPSGTLQSRVRRVPSHGTDIWRLEAVNGLCRSLCAQPVPLDQARKQLQSILENRPQYPQWVILAAYFLGAGMFTMFFGGAWTDGLWAGVCGAALGLMRTALDRWGANLFLKTIAGGAVSALLALGFARLGLGESVDLVTIGPLMILVPGVALTNAVRDIMVGDMISGIAKLGEALLVATAIALGTGLALAVGGLG